MTRWPWNGLSTQSSFHFSPLLVCQKAKFMIINLCLLTNNRSMGKTPKQLPINASIHFSLANIRENDSIIFFGLLKSDKNKNMHFRHPTSFFMYSRIVFFLLSYLFVYRAWDIKSPDWQRNWDDFMILNECNNYIFFSRWKYTLIVLYL